jgi:RND family efflux transporter MFP subunit
VAQDVVDSVLVEEGQTVKEGQIVVQLRKDREELAVEEARKRVEIAAFKARGFAELAKSNMTSKDNALEAQTAYDLAGIVLAARQQDLKEKSIRSTLTGIVVKKYKEAGEGLDKVEKLIDVIDIDKVFAQFYISPKLLPSVHVKDPVTIHVADLENAAFSGNIDFISPSLDAASGLVRVKVLIDNPDHKMKANMKAVADFTKHG